MRITSKGQVTIPQAVREAAGLTPGTEVEFSVEDGAVKLVKVRGTAIEPGTGRQRMREAIAAARAAGALNASTEEIMLLTRGEWPYQGP